MIDTKLALYIVALVFSTGVAVSEFRRLKRDFDKHETEVDGDIQGLRDRKASKTDLQKLEEEVGRDVNGIGKKAEGIRDEIKQLREREDRRFREFGLIVGRMTNDPAILGAIQDMASRNGG